MTVPDHTPYAEQDPMAELVEECRCVEQECAVHGVDLHPTHHLDPARHVDGVVIDDHTRHLVDDYSEYGA